MNYKTWLLIILACLSLSVSTVSYRISKVEHSDEKILKLLKTDIKEISEENTRLRILNQDLSDQLNRMIMDDKE